MLNQLSWQQRTFAFIVFAGSLLFGLLLPHFIKHEMWQYILLTAILFATLLFSSGLILGIKDHSDPFGWRYHLLSFLCMNAGYLLALVLQQAAASFYRDHVRLGMAWGVLLIIHYILINRNRQKSNEPDA